MNLKTKILNQQIPSLRVKSGGPEYRIFVYGEN